MSERLNYSPEQGSALSSDTSVTEMPSQDEIFIDLETKFELALHIAENPNRYHIFSVPSITEVNGSRSNVVEVIGTDGRVHYVQEHYTSDRWDDLNSAENIPSE